MLYYVICFYASLATSEKLSLTGCDDTCGDYPAPYSRIKREIGNLSYSDEYAEYYGNYDQEDHAINDEDTRIVNGYDAENRPWLTFIASDKGACGGALINTK